MTLYPITYRHKGSDERERGTVEGPDMESALATFKRDNPETISHCIYNPEHLES